MTKQKPQPDLGDFLVHADKYLDLVISFFKGMQERLDEEIKDTKVDSTWAAATDDVSDDTPVADDGPERKPTAEDLYVELLERRAYEHARRSEMNAAAAIRRIINELRELDNFKG